MRKNSKKTAEVFEFKRLIHYFEEHGAYPEDADPELKRLAVEFEARRVELQGKIQKREAK